VSSAGETHGYEKLVSTMPLPDLVNALDPSPRRVSEAGRMLRWRTVHCVNIGVKKKDRTPSHWIYFPEPGYVFYRVGFIHNICRKSVPGGHSAYYVEIATDPNERVDGEALARRSMTDLARAGILDPHDDVTEVQYLPMPYAYVVYDRARSSAVRLILDFLEEHGIHSVGRYGGWKYSAMENAILDGKSVADKLRSK
jgi:UDP-galactopyranose mutase